MSAKAKRSPARKRTARKGPSRPAVAARRNVPKQAIARSAIRKRTLAHRPVRKSTISQAPRRLAARKPARRPVQQAAVRDHTIRKLTLSSPICNTRVAALDDVLSNLPAIDAINSPTGSVVTPITADLTPAGLDQVIAPGDGGGVPGTPGFPGGGDFPGVPGVLLPPIVGGNEGGTDPTEPPVVPPDNAVPEPASWAMMLIGFASVGATMRRRRRIPAR